MRNQGFRETRVGDALPDTTDLTCPLQVSSSVEAFDAIGMAGQVVGDLGDGEVYRDRIVLLCHVIGDGERRGAIAVVLNLAAGICPVRRQRPSTHTLREIGLVDHFGDGGSSGRSCCWMR